MRRLRDLLSIRTYQPLADNEMPDIFNLAAEGRHRSSSGLQYVLAMDWTVLTSRRDVEAEITAYFTALFHGRHVAAAGNPVDSGATFQPDESLYPFFLDGLPSISSEQ
jgi:hypothetical protein